MRRMRITSYLQAAYVEGEAPAHATIRRGIDDGKIPGERIGGVYYVYVDSDLRLATNHTKQPTIRPVNDSAATIFKDAGLIQ